MEQNNRTSSDEMIEKKSDYFAVARDVLARWWLILFTAIFAAMCTYVIVTELYSPKYVSEANLVVYSTESGANATSNTTLTEDMAAAFSSIVSSNAMKGIVKDNTGYVLKDEMVTATIIEETNLIKVTVTTASPVKSYEILNTIITNHNTLTNQIMENSAMEVLNSPSIATKPSNDMKRGQFSLLVFVIAAVLVVLVEIYNSIKIDTAKNRKDFGAGIDAELLCEIGHEKKYKTFTQRLKREKASILITNPHTSFGLVETVKKLRTKVVYKCKKTNAQTIMVTSVLENEGKTTVSINLALSLAQKGANVLLVDADMRRPAVAKALDIGEVKNGFTEILRGKIPYTAALMKDSNTGLYLLPCAHGSSNVFSKTSPAVIKKLFEALKAKMDYIVIDTPPMSMVADSEVFAELCDASILVVRQNVVEIADINDAVESLQKSGSSFLGCVFNNVFSGFGISIAGNGGYVYNYGYGGYNYRYRYGYYGGYGKYGSYGGYGSNGKYGKYDRNGSYGKYGQYGRYGVQNGESGDENSLDSDPRFEPLELENSEGSGTAQTTGSSRNENQ